MGKSFVSHLSDESFNECEKDAKRKQIEYLKKN